MIVQLSNYSILVPTFITEIEYKLLWAIRGYSLDNKIVQHFTALYGLTRTEIPIPPLDEVPVYLFEAFLWAYIKVAVDDGVFDCASPCKLLTFQK